MKAKGKEVYYYSYFGPANTSTLEKVRLSKVQHLIVDHYIAKLVTPKKTGTGTTGIYIDSLWKAGDHPDGFVMSSTNLTFKQQQQLVEAIKTLKFYQHPDKRQNSNKE